MTVATRNPILSALVIEPGPNPLADIFFGWDRRYKPGAIEKVKGYLEQLLETDASVEFISLSIKTDSQEYKMMADLLLHFQTASQLAKAAGRQINMEINLKSVGYIFRFQPLQG